MALIDDRSSLSTAGDPGDDVTADTERRSYKRTPLEAEVSLTSESEFFVGLLNDISCGGVFVSTYRPLPIGTRVEIELSLPDQSVRATGTVRWSRDASSGQPPGIGVAFDRLSDATASAVRDFCSKRPPLFHDID